MPDRKEHRTHAAGKGDRNVRISRGDVAAALRSVGVEPGDTVMFHSSLSSVGWVEGGAGAALDGFLDAVDPGGTVAVPTLCNWAPDEQALVFERWRPQTSPSYVGRISEALRGRPDARRSDHATHSVAAVGRRAEELTARHGDDGLRPGPFGDKAFARESPWERLYLWNAAYVFVGVTFRVCTMVHYVETRVVERALLRAAAADRKQLAARVRGWMTTGVWPTIAIDDREVFESALAEKGGVVYGKMGSATLRMARVRPLVDGWIDIVERNPARWLDDEFRQWLRAVGVRAVGG